MIVTAQQQEENIQNVVMSVTAISGESLEARGARDLPDVLRAMPGVGLTNAVPGQTTVTLRGVPASTGDAPVVFYLDDVQLSSGSANNGCSLGANPMGAPHPRVMDLNRVEVLRGPQGTLYGASSMAVPFDSSRTRLRSIGGKRRLRPTPANSEGTSSPNYQAQFVFNVPVVDDHVTFRASMQDGSTASDLNRETYSDAPTPAVLNRRSNSAD